MRLGIGTYCYMWSLGFPGAEPPEPMTAPNLLETAIDLGVRVVQFGPNYGLQSLSAADRERAVSMARERGIELELGARGLDAPHILEMVRLTRSCGARLLRTVPAEKPGGSMMSAAEMEAALRAVVHALEGEDVVLAIENALIPARTLKALLESVGCSRIGITLDTVNSLAISEGVREVAETLAPFTRCLHVKDYAVSRQWHMMGFQVEGRPAGGGQLDVPWLLDLLRGCGSDANAIVECWVPEQQTLDATIALERRWAAESVSYLRTLIPE